VEHRELFLHTPHLLAAAVAAGTCSQHQPAVAVTGFLNQPAAAVTGYQHQPAAAVIGCHQPVAEA
jgi:hypothetical protein